MPEIAARFADAAAIFGAGGFILHRPGRWDILLLCVVLLATTIAAFNRRHLYREPERFYPLKIGVAWCKAFGVAMLLLLLAGLAIDEGAVRPPPAIAQAVRWQPRELAAIFAVAGAALMGVRLALAWSLRLGAKTAASARRTVVVGATANGARLAAFLATRRPGGIEVVGLVDDRLEDEETDTARRGPGGIDRLMALIEGERVDFVLIALPWTEADRIEALVRRLSVTHVTIGLAPDFEAFRFPHWGVSSLAGLPIVDLGNRRLSAWDSLIKRTADLVFASCLLLLLAPLMAAIAAAIKLDSPGPVLFGQRRYGLGNTTFRILKFRTMHPDLCDEDGRLQVTRGDTRLTRVGAVLRRFSLDELPQLFNVLKGEMSMVGPRPHALSTLAAGRLFEEAVATYMMRHRVKPGITGWAQVNGWRGETDTLEKLAKRVEHDLYYIGNWSLKLDLVIMIRSVKVVLAAANAY